MIRVIKTFRFFFLFMVIFLSENLCAQKTANQILFGVYQKMLNAKDYVVDAHIKVDLPFIKMLPVEAEIYFKQPDRFKVKSKGIAILPKQGFSDFSKTIKDSNSYVAIIAGKETIVKSIATLLNIIPNADTSDLILGKLWIDTEKNLVLKSQLTTKSNGTILVEYIYNSQIYYGLPDSMIFTVDVKKFKVPKGVSADINNPGSPKNDTGKEPKKGKIYITLKNYRVNKGIPESIFTN